MMAYQLIFCRITCANYTFMCLTIMMPNSLFFVKIIYTFTVERLRIVIMVNLLFQKLIIFMFRNCYLRIFINSLKIAVYFIFVIVPIFIYFNLMLRVNPIWRMFWIVISIMRSYFYAKIVSLFLQFLKKVAFNILTTNLHFY